MVAVFLPINLFRVTRSCYLYLESDIYRIFATARGSTLGISHLSVGIGADFDIFKVVPNPVDELFRP